ncbi:hypothetical protein PCE1_001587 [Barthelona sp. PCE]
MSIEQFGVSDEPPTVVDHSTLTEDTIDTEQHNSDLEAETTDSNVMSNAQATTSDVESDHKPENSTSKVSNTLTNSDNESEAESEEGLERRHYLILGLFLLLSLCMMTLETSVAPALPKFEEDFPNYSSTVYSLLLAVFLMVNAATQTVVSAYFEQIGGLKEGVIFLLGYYAVFNIIAGFLDNLILVIIFRSLSAVGVASFVLLMSISVSIFPKSKIEMVLGILEITFSVGIFISIIVGGIIIDVAGWRTCFVSVGISLLICLIPCYLIIEHVPVKNDGVTMDIAGGSALFFILISITGFAVFIDIFDHPLIYLTLVAAVLLFYIFYKIEKKAEFPIIPLVLYKNRNLMSTAVAIAICSLGMFNIIYAFPLMLNDLFNITSTTEIAFTIIFDVILQPIGAVVVPRMMKSKDRPLNPMTSMASGIFGCSLSYFGFLMCKTVNHFRFVLFIYGLFLGFIFVSISIAVVTTTQKITEQFDFEAKTVALAAIHTISSVFASLAPVIASRILSATADDNGLNTRTGFNIIFLISAVLLFFASIFAALVRDPCNPEEDKEEDKEKIDEEIHIVIQDEKEFKVVDVTDSVLKSENECTNDA